VHASRRYVLAAMRGGTWAAVEGIRLHEDELEIAIETVQAFLAETDTRTASWWLTELSTPCDIEELLLAAGLERDESDYLHSGMLITTEPPDSDVDARRVGDVHEYIAARRLKEAVFGTYGRDYTDAELAADYERASEVTYGAWIDGELVASASASFMRVGALLSSGATLPEARGRGAYRALVRARWDDAVARGTPALAVGAGPMSQPILERLGFEQVVQFRRLQSVVSRP
jgi:GNAT superfamily N-acetyltransferase